MPTNLKEIGFEEAIEQYLTRTNGYQVRKPEQYSKQLCMDTELVLEFLKITQPDAWEKLAEKHGDAVEQKVLARIDEEITSQGVLAVLRNGVKDRGIKLDLAYFRPASSMNPETLELYNSNILSVMRQVKYSEDNENSIDMVLFLNGLPIFTAELKNQLTGQTVQNAMRQYRSDRDPKEKLLGFKRCLVHFAIDTDLVYMTTRLAGRGTYFLPFNKGENGSAGNPTNPDGFKTSYMWAEIWKKDLLLELVGNFICLTVEEKTHAKGKKYKEEKLIFPRYHQLDTVRRIVADAREVGAGKNYLIQHSAGSGKSNTIAWTAHHLSSLHNADDKKVFDTVIVVTDRRVLDKQLRDTVKQFEQTAGVVKAIEEGSSQLKDSLEQGEKIIITTLQKFPFIVEEVGKLPGKTFAVIIDEAHSSQSGEASKSLRDVLMIDSKDEDAKLEEAVKEDKDTEEPVEDFVLRQMKARKAKTDNISFFAFTATPKQKTLEVFGTQSPLDGKFYPFSLYSMKQAIEERFILDVLKNYTPYKVHFSLLKKVEDDPEFKKKKAQQLLLQYVERHEHAIKMKVETMADHFDKFIAQKLDGKAKAMIVTKSRLHAVRYKQAFDTYLKEKGLDYKAMVAFSGTVKDAGAEYTEGGMNGVPEKNTAEEFKKDEYKFMIVAEKFQTGFDQPLLSVMYVDKKLSGVNAVQTLSRLNRSMAGKEEVYVLDFVNDTDDIIKAFQPYYTTTVLSAETDPNTLHNLERDILNFKHFDIGEVDQFVEAYFKNAKPDTLNSMLDGYVDRFLGSSEEEQDDFRGVLTDYVRKYAFIAQIIDFEDTDLEKLYIFGKFLKKKLPIRKDRLPVEVLESIDMDSYKIEQRATQTLVLEDENGIIEPMTNGNAGRFEDEYESLSDIIKDVNDKFGTDFSSEDRVILNNLSLKLLEDANIAGAIQNNTRGSAKIKFDDVFNDELVNMVNSHFDLYKKLDKNKDAKEYVRSRIFNFLLGKVKQKSNKTI
ncbi:MAG: restriction endonuclease subunit R [Candidatus Magasanikbacteria bacterium CG11_big_fil_rev_8_21_14_0_20_39_34]|uniref:Restriction endonuclease subunit R n=1 Tax=Candidatus Magasanikbacteria bacterium CG11_big_fil_rev_8_21_14_0_20_39_34 TaxID=1974653 RepID=A0A2H0N4Y5_9BACT|nr:MAG: restriction endonuclease subunit R [Candidatus Magasanikbacteria bacterium CG11_big_fil_rev_8_21_14_0_20_39_34]